jgi:hypothetical protein
VSFSVKSLGNAAGLGRSVLAPEGNEYPGMGANFGESVVEGLKVQLLGLRLGSGPKGRTGSSETALFDWTASPRELEISQGINDVVEDTALVPNGTYEWLEVIVASKFAVKAYAYMDGNNDGTIDTTLYTTAADVVKADKILPPTEIPDYDYYEYGFMYTYASDRAVKGPGSAGTAGSTTDALAMTMFPSPLVLADGIVPPDGGPALTEAKVSLLIDSFRVVKAWDGRYGTTPNYAVGDGSLHDVGYPFPYADNDTRTMNRWGLASHDFFAKGEPDFGLQYIPMFSFVNTERLNYHTYLLAPKDAFTPYNSQILTVVFDENGSPIIGKIGMGEDDETLRLGQSARHFEALGEGSYRFYTDGADRDENGVEDGGFFYTDKKEHAGHIVEGLRLLPTLGDEATVTVKDGPRCKGEYDLCLYGTGKTAYVKRVNR